MYANSTNFTLLGHCIDKFVTKVCKLGEQEHTIGTTTASINIPMPIEFH